MRYRSWPAATGLKPRLRQAGELGQPQLLGAGGRLDPTAGQAGCGGLSVQPQADHRPAHVLSPLGEGLLDHPPQRGLVDADGWRAAAKRDQHGIDVGPGPEDRPGHPPDHSCLGPVCHAQADRSELPIAGSSCESLAHLPEGPPLYPEGEPDPGEVPEERFVAEVIREKALALVHDELPHSVAVLVEEIVPGEQASPDNPVLVVRADLYVERASQKPIVIGRQGAVLREIGSRARAELEPLLGARVFLDLHVRIAREWQRDPKLLARLGF